MIRVSKSELTGKEMVMGTATVAFDPKTYNNPGKKPMTNMQFNVENWKGNRVSDMGKPIYERISYRAVAYDKMAAYCACLEKGDTVFFVGYRTVDNYSTEKDPNGKVHYQVTLEYCAVQPDAPTEYTGANFNDSKPVDTQTEWSDEFGEEEIPF